MMMMMMMIVWLGIMPFSTPTDGRSYECCIATRESREDIPDGLGAFEDGDDNN
jgi:hypothetical protein